MTPTRDSGLGWFGAWTLATLLFVVALAARFALVGVLPAHGFPFLTFFPAVMLTAYVCGLGPGIAVSMASIVAARYFFIEPAHAFGGMSQGDTVALVFFALVLLVDCVVVHVMANALDRLRRTTQALAESRQALQAADRRKDAYLATLAHELRNPLAPMAVATRLLADAHATPDTRRTATATLDRQVGLMSRLLDDLLDASRVTLDKMRVHPRPVAIGELVASALQAATPLLQARGHALACGPVPVDAWVDADPVRIEQVLVNLLANAAKFTPEGGRVWLDVDATATDVTVAVHDTGVGLSPAQSEAVFELFAQVDQAQQAEGLGIGLHLARALARLHGGDVRVRSDGPGRGATFTLQLPRLARSEAWAAGAVEAAVPHAAAARRLLVADDNRDNADMLALLCRQAGLDVQVRYDGASAWQAAQDHQPHAVLLDIGMPHVDGLTLARRIRDTPWGAQARLVALSGWDGPDDRARTRDAGFDVHLVKPANPDALLQALAG